MKNKLVSSKLSVKCSIKEPVLKISLARVNTNHEALFTFTKKSLKKNFILSAVIHIITMIYMSSVAHITYETIILTTLLKFNQNSSIIDGKL